MDIERRAISRLMPIFTYSRIFGHDVVNARYLCSNLSFHLPVPVLLFRGVAAGTYLISESGDAAFLLQVRKETKLL